VLSCTMGLRALRAGTLPIYNAGFARNMGEMY
jgi:hypothetical protein